MYESVDIQEMNADFSVTIEDKHTHAEKTGTPCEMCRYVMEHGLLAHGTAPPVPVVAPHQQVQSDGVCQMFCTADAQSGYQITIKENGRTVLRVNPCQMCRYKRGKNYSQRKAQPLMLARSAQPLMLVSSRPPSAGKIIAGVVIGGLSWAACLALVENPFICFLILE